METWVLPRSNGLDAEFEGERIAYISSAETSEQDKTRWTELAIYLTCTGRYVCQQVGKSIRPGEYDFNEVEVVDDIAGVLRFFGSGWLSKKLYEMAGIAARELIA